MTTTTSNSVPLRRRVVSRRLQASSVIRWFSVGIVAIAVVMAVGGRSLAPYNPDAVNLTYAYVGPMGGHLLGFDAEGRDLLSRTIVGARTSMVGPLLVVLLSITGGTLLALAAAWWRGWTDSAISSLLDVLFAFPAVLLAILAATVFGSGLTAAGVGLSIAYIPYVARVLRAAAVRERGQEYIAALEVQGQSAFTICIRHIVPNMLRLIVAEATILFGWAVLDLAAISFVGLGVQPPQADWGVMVSEGSTGVLQGYPAESLAAGIAIVLVVVAVNVLGESLADRSLERDTWA